MLRLIAFLSLLSFSAGHLAFSDTALLQSGLSEGKQRQLARLLASYLDHPSPDGPEVRALERYIEDLQDVSARIQNRSDEQIRGVSGPIWRKWGTISASALVLGVVYFSSSTYLFHQQPTREHFVQWLMDTVLSSYTVMGSGAVALVGYLRSDRAKDVERARQRSQLASDLKPFFKELKQRGYAPPDEPVLRAHVAFVIYKALTSPCEGALGELPYWLGLTAS